MDPIFLTPETTVKISIRTTFEKVGESSLARYEIEDGGPYEIRTATGREFAAIQQAYGRQDADAAYSLVQKFLVGGVGDGLDAKAKSALFESLHPDLVWRILFEVLRRSRPSETDQKK